MTFITREKAFGLKWYSAAYRIGQAYRNPDAPIGSLGLGLLYGFSEFGKDFQLDLLMAMTDKLTITAQAIYANIDPPFKTNKTAALGLRWYP